MTEVKKEVKKARGASMTLAQRYEVMHLVKNGDPRKPDADVAVEAGKLPGMIGREVSQQTIAEYRRAFGMQSVRKPTAAELAARVAELEAKLAQQAV